MLHKKYDLKPNFLHSGIKLKKIRFFEFFFLKKPLRLRNLTVLKKDLLKIGC